jgi:hypothetical protein
MKGAGEVVAKGSCHATEATSALGKRIETLQTDTRRRLKPPRKGNFHRNVLRPVDSAKAISLPRAHVRCRLGSECLCQMETSPSAPVHKIVAAKTIGYHS